jgi:hypothetical protein
LTPPLTHVIHTLINIPVAPYSSIWFSSNLDGKIAGKSDIKRTPGETLDTLRRTYDLLDTTLSYYTPDDPDDPSVRARCQNDDVSFDDTVPPLVILLSKIVKEDANSRVRFKNWILPAHL